MTKATKEERCPKCDGERHCEVHGHTTTNWDWSNGQNSQEGGADHWLLECRGCKHVFYVRDTWFSEDYDQRYDSDGNVITELVRTKIAYPPFMSKKSQDLLEKMSDLDGQLFQMMLEIYSGYWNENYILTSIGLRTVFELVANQLGIHVERFAAKLSELKSRGWISDKEFEILEAIVEAGNAAAHRSWRPSRAQVKEMLSLTENFLERTLISGKVIVAMKKDIPHNPNRGPMKLTDEA